jgi:hypothetical protein
MPRFIRFTFVVNPDEREMIRLVAKEMERSESDAIRLIIKQTAKELFGPYQNNDTMTLLSEDDIAGIGRWKLEVKS